MKTNEKITDILKRLDTIENCLLKLTPVIDLAHDYEDRVTALEKLLINKEEKPMAKRLLEGTELDNCRLQLKNFFDQHYLNFLEVIRKLPISHSKLLARTYHHLEQANENIQTGLMNATIEVIDESKPVVKPEENKGESELGVQGVGKDVVKDEVKDEVNNEDKTNVA